MIEYRYLSSKMFLLLGVLAFIVITPISSFPTPNTSDSIIMLAASASTYVAFLFDLKKEFKVRPDKMALAVFAMSISPYLLLISFVNLPEILLALIIIIALCDAFDSSSALLPNWAVYSLFALTVSYAFFLRDHNDVLIASIIIGYLSLVGFKVSRVVCLPEADTILLIVATITLFICMPSLTQTFTQFWWFFLITLGVNLSLLPITKQSRLFALLSLPIAILLTSSQLLK